MQFALGRATGLSLTTGNRRSGTEAPPVLPGVEGLNVFLAIQQLVAMISTYSGSGEGEGGGK